MKTNSYTITRYLELDTGIRSIPLAGGPNDPACDEVQLFKPQARMVIAWSVQGEGVSSPPCPTELANDSNLRFQSGRKIGATPMPDVDGKHWALSGEYVYSMLVPPPNLSGDFPLGRLPFDPDPSNNIVPASNFQSGIIDTNNRAS